MRRLVSAFGLVVLCCVAFAGQASASQLRLSQAGSTQFPDRAFLLTLSARTNLAPADVSVAENGVPVSGLTVDPASKLGESRFGTVLLIDASLSMNGAAIRDSVKAAYSFIQTRNPQQPVGIIFFSQTSRVAVPMTTNTTALQDALTGIPVLHLGTHIFDAAAAALRMLAQAHSVGGSIILLSDGADTGSRTSEGSVASLAQAHGVRVYTVGAQDPSFVGSTLQSLATATGGVYLPVQSGSLAALYRGLGLELSNQYLIRYQSIVPLGHPVTVVVKVRGYGSASTGYSTPPLPVVPGVSAQWQHNSFWTSAIAALIVSVTGGVLLGLAVAAVLSRREGVRARVAGFVSTTGPKISAKPRTLVQRALGDPRLRRRERSRWFDALVLELDVARINLSPIRVILLTLAGTGLLAFILFVTTSSPVAVIVALAVPVAARVGIRMLANRQRRRFDEQLPDNLQVIASALRAGHTFVGAMGVMVQDAPEPSRRELRRALADEQLGVPLADALTVVSTRMRSSDFQQVALVATLHRDTGGNTAEVIDVVTETIRDRIDLRRLIRSLTAQGRLSGLLLTCLPILLLIAISLIAPSYVRPLFHETAGIIALAVAVILVISGSVVIRRIVDIEV